MKQNPGGLPKGDSRRSDIARQIWAARDAEEVWREKNLINLDRSGGQYLVYFRGLQNLFGYVAKLRSNVILDIGAGTARAMNDFSKSKLGSGLVFKATVLRYDSEIKKNLKAQNVHVSPVETLRGVPDSSVGCALAHISIGYSTSPDLAVKSIDRVLVPGGVLKAVFPSATIHIERAGILKGPQEFRDELTNIGYDVDDCHFDGTTIILGVKPGGEMKVDARNLLHADESTSVDQSTSYMNELNENAAKS